MPEAKPLLSICIPVFNGGELLDKALQSCLGQTYENIEIVVVDNASTDNTAEVVKRFSSDPRIKYFRNEETVPIMRNFYKTFHYATGEFVQHLGHDDWLARDYAEKAVESFRKDPETGAVMHRLLSFVIAGGKMTLNNDISIPSGRYPVDYFARRVFNSRIGGLSFLATMRRQDVLEAENSLSPLYGHPLYGKMYEGAQGTDWIVLLKVLAKYKHFTFSNAAAFIKTDHRKNAGYTFGHDLSNPAGILRYRDFSRSCLDPTYREDYPHLRSFMRVVVASLAVSDMAFYIFRRRLSPDAFRKISAADWKIFFKDYTAGERLWTAFYSLYLFARRSIEHYLRRAPGPIRHPEQFFLDNEFSFKA